MPLLHCIKCLFQFLQVVSIKIYALSEKLDSFKKCLFNLKVWFEYSISAMIYGPFNSSAGFKSLYAKALFNVWIQPEITGCQVWVSYEGQQTVSILQLQLIECWGIITEKFEALHTSLWISFFQCLTTAGSFSPEPSQYGSDNMYKAMQILGCCATYMYILLYFSQF